MKKAIFFLFSLTTWALVFGNQDYLFFSPEMITSHIKEYSTQEKEAILKDLEVVRSVCTPSLESGTSKKPLYIATAGAPGSRKTTILERFINTYALTSYITYLDPDQRGLKFMPHTYYSQSLSAYIVSKNKNYLQASQNAYEKWRGASNFITLTLLEEAFAKRQNIAHGTTSTGGHISSFLSEVKKAGYETILLLCSAEEDFRVNAIEYRNNEQKFYQSSPEDAINKRKIFPSKMETYFSKADSLYIFWSDELFQQERLGAILSKGELKVIDANALNSFVLQFEKDRKDLSEEGQNILSWNELVDLYQKRFNEQIFANTL